MQIGDHGYVVLTLIALRGPSTAYDVERALDHFSAEYWSVPHTQVYRECERLRRDGLLRERREATGRRRRVYSLTPRGRREVTAWVRTPTDASLDIRDIVQFKLLATELSTTEDVRRVALAQVAAYERRLQVLDGAEARFARRPELALRMLSVPMGRAVYEAALRFWRRIADDPPDVEAFRRSQRRKR